MRDPKDLARELVKVSDVMDMAVSHFDHEASMNAALHMSTVVRPAPLAAALTGARADLARLIDELVGDE